jgi:hypothetical protein
MLQFKFVTELKYIHLGYVLTNKSVMFKKQNRIVYDSLLLKSNDTA